MGVEYMLMMLEEPSEHSVKKTQLYTVLLPPKSKATLPILALYLDHMEMILF